MSEDATADDQTRVFLLIENRPVRETLARVCHKHADLCVVGQGCSVDAIATHDSECDILVLHGFQMLSLLATHLLDGKAAESAIGVVLIGMEEDEEQFLLAVRSGVSCYLLNDASASDVVAAIRAAARGEAVCPPRLCRALFREVTRLARQTPVQSKLKPESGLTIRQQQLLSLVAKGLTNKEIASRLSLSEFTIKNHIHRIMKLEQAMNRYEAVEAARASGYHLMVDSAPVH